MSFSLNNVKNLGSSFCSISTDYYLRTRSICFERRSDSILSYCYYCYYYCYYCYNYCYCYCYYYHYYHVVVALPI